MLNSGYLKIQKLFSVQGPNYFIKGPNKSK